MVFISFVDWFLSRSQAFHLLIERFGNHKINTQGSFRRIKQTHTYYNSILKGHEARLRELENIISSLKETNIKIIKKRKT